MRVDSKARVRGGQQQHRRFGLAKKGSATGPLPDEERTWSTVAERRPQRFVREGNFFFFFIYNDGYGTLPSCRNNCAAEPEANVCLARENND